MNAYRAIGIGAFVATGTILAAFAVFGLTLNTTPSYPRGLWAKLTPTIPTILARIRTMPLLGFFLQEGPHGLELGAKAAPISSFQALHRPGVVAEESLTGVIGPRSS